MHVTLKIMEKLDDLLEEADEYIKCANMHSDDPELRSAYTDLARCHFDGYEKLSKCCERSVERKTQSMPEGQREAVREMVAWHRDKFEKRAAEIKHKLEAR